MSWARFDDRYHDNRKVKRAWRRHPRAVGLHAMAVTYCSMHETDGWVDAEWLEDKLPAKTERDKCLEALVAVGLFEPHDNGDFRVHDFLEYNKSRDERDALREQKADRQRKWRETRRETERSASTDASTDVSRSASRDAAPPQTPTRPAPPRPTSSSAAADKEDSADVIRLCDLLASLILENDPKAKVTPDSRRWRDSMRLLLDNDGRDPIDVERVIRWCQADEFWRTNILSAHKLREQYTQLWLRAANQNGTTTSGSRTGPTAEDFLAIARGEQ